MKIKKAFVIVLPCIVLVALGAWMYSRWDIWFNNPPEPDYSSSYIPSRVLLTFGNEDGMTRNISWQCDSTLHDSKVELLDETDSTLTEIKAAGEVFKSLGGQRAYYVAKLRNLLAGHHYKYRVNTNGKTSQWYNFHLQESKDLDASFIYVGDVQDSISGLSTTLLEQVFAKNPETEFLVCGGDLIERPMDKYWEEAFSCFQNIGQTHPVLTITGNHDYFKGVIQKLDHRFSLVHSYFLDSSIGDNQVFTVRYKDMQLFAIDSNREFFYLFTQKKWLEEQLQKSTAKWKILLTHHPLYSIRGNSNNIIQKWIFNPLVEKYGVDLVLQGHEHAYARMTQHQDTGEPAIPIYTVSHFSPKNYLIHFDEKFNKFGSGSRYYQKIESKNDTLLITAYDALSHALYDSLRIVKKGEEKIVEDCGKDIPEIIEFIPGKRKKEIQFAERIEAYKKRKHIK